MFGGALNGFDFIVQVIHLTAAQYLSENGLFDQCLIAFAYKGFYRQLFMKLPSLCQQGFFFSKPDGSPRWLCSPSMLFGGDEYPNFSMRAAAALVAAITRRLQEFEERLQQAATSGDEIAILHCPAELQTIKSTCDQKFKKEGVFTPEDFAWACAAFRSMQNQWSRLSHP